MTTRHVSWPYTSASLDPQFLRGCAELALALPVGGLAPAVPLLLSPASFPGDCRCQITAGRDVAGAGPPLLTAGEWKAELASQPC